MNNIIQFPVKTAEQVDDKARELAELMQGILPFFSVEQVVLAMAAVATNPDDIALLNGIQELMREGTA